MVCAQAPGRRLRAGRCVIPRWLLVAIALATLAVFLGDYAAQFIVDGYKSNPAIITTFGAISGLVFMLARGDRGKKPGSRDRAPDTAQDDDGEDES